MGRGLEKIKWKKYILLREKYFSGSFFFIKQNHPYLEQFKNCIGGWICRIYINSSNLIYIVIIFLK